MMNLSIFRTALQKFALSLLFFLAIGQAATAQFGVAVESIQNGNEVTVNFAAHNFQDIAAMQFSMSFDPAAMTFTGFGSFGLPDLAANSFGTSSAADGVVTMAWFDPTTLGVSIPSCSSMFSLKFELNGTEIPPVIIANSPTIIEVVQIISDDPLEVEELQLIQTGSCALGMLDLRAVHDEDGNCAPGANEAGLEGWIVQLEQNGIEYFFNTQTGGQVSTFLGEGNYMATVLAPANGLWTVCGAPQTFTITEGETSSLEFTAQALIDCPALSIDLSAPFLRRCFSSYYQVEYCNDGTLPAIGAYVEIEFDPALEVLTSSLPWSSVDGNTYTFQLGDVAVGECGNFSVEVLVDCDSELGQTHCSTALIFPDDPCTTPSPLWDGSSLEVTGECDGEEVVFTITNTGNDMTAASEFIVIEDDMLALKITDLLLAADETRTVNVPANGSTYRMEVTQTEYHPGLDMPSTTVEGCVDGAGTVSLGFVTQFPQNDLSPVKDIDCQENIGSWDPNDKIGYPIGYGAEHFILPGTEIEYRIRFQNTGSDTAFNIVVLDTLSPSLDPTTVRPGASSHPFEFEVTGNGILKFSFPNILLPDSTTNLEGSNGFVKFTISPRNVPLGTVIENDAAIYFDFNPPVITNTVRHTIEEDFITQEPSAAGFTPFSDVQIYLAPNPIPAGGRPLLQVQSQKTMALHFQVYDTDGKHLFSKNETLPVGTSLTQLPIGLSPGVYFIHVADGAGQGQALRLLVR